MRRRRPSLVVVAWIAAAACFVLLVAGLVAKETLSASGCSGPRRAEADAFARDLVARGPAAARTHVASFTRSVARSIPELGRATAAETEAVVASGQPDGPACRLFLPGARAIRPAPGLCYGYGLPPRLAFILGGYGPQIEFAVTVACDHGRWRINGFI